MPNGKARYRPTIDRRSHSWNVSQYKQLQEKREKIYRGMKKQMKAQGTIANKVPFIWEWRCGDEFGTVSSFTRSEARAEIKKMLNISKKKPLPRDVQIRKVEFNEPIT